MLCVNSFKSARKLLLSCSNGQYPCVKDCIRLLNATFNRDIYVAWYIFQLPEVAFLLIDEPYATVLAHQKGRPPLCASLEVTEQ